MLGAILNLLAIDKRETKIRSMFNNIAPSYDLLNHLLSLNIDKYWRWRTTAAPRPLSPDYRGEGSKRGPHPRSMHRHRRSGVGV
jgi:hypothetical protein